MYYSKNVSIYQDFLENLSNFSSADPLLCLAQCCLKISNRKVLHLPVTHRPIFSVKNITKMFKRFLSLEKLIFYCIIFAVYARNNTALNERFIVIVRDKPFVFSKQKLVVILSVKRQIGTLRQADNTEKTFIAYLARTKMKR